MKTKILLLLIAGFAFFMLSCNGDPVGVSNEDTSTDTYSSGSSHDPLTDPSGYEPSLLPKAELVFTWEDVKSFNITTREIVFTDIIFEKLTTAIDECDYNRLTIYYGDSPLFKEIPKTSPFSSLMINDLVFIFDDGKFSLSDGYPEEPPPLWSVGNQPQKTKEDALKIREENAERRKIDWDIFIRYLNEVGKIVR